MDDLTNQQVSETVKAYADPAAYAQRNDGFVHPDLEAFLEAIPAGLVVDLGAGTGRDARRMISKGREVLAVDASPQMVAYLNENDVTARQGDLRDLSDLPYDLAGVWMNASLLHVPRADAASAVRQVAEHLTVNGRLMVGVKEGSGSFKDTFQGLSRYTTLYQVSELEEYVGAAGMKVTQVRRDATDPRGVTWIYLHAVR